MNFKCREQFFFKRADGEPSYCQKQSNVSKSAFPVLMQYAWGGEQTIWDGDIRQVTVRYLKTETLDYSWHEDSCYDLLIVEFILLTLS